MALSHVVMHLALCSAAARLKQSTLPVRVVVTDRIHRDVADTTANVARTGAADGTAEFDIPWGVYRAQATLHAGGITCSQSQFFSVLADHNRELTMQLEDGTPPRIVPAIVHGALPAEFSYASPQIVVFGDTKCDAPVGTPIDAKIEQHDDDQAFYASVYPSAALARNTAATPALRLTDSSGGYHYVRLPKNFLSFNVRMPDIAQVDISDGLIDFLAGKPEDTLLCLKATETTTQ